MIGITGKFLAVSLLLLFGIAVSCNIWVLFICLLLLLIFFICANDLTNNIFLILYLIAFFTFLVGGQFVYEFFGYQMPYSFNDEEYNYLNLALFVSVICIGIGYYSASKVKFKLRKAEHTSVAPVNTIRVIAKISFYFLLVPRMFTLLEDIISVYINGYMSYYTYESQLPGIIVELSEIFTASFCLLLATTPTKDEARGPIMVYTVLTALTLFTGRRIYFVTQFFLILAYCLYRNNEKETWISRKTLLGLILISPAIAIFLYSIKYIRYGREIQATSALEAFLSFFQQQGFSANLIGLEYRYEYALTDHCYSFYDILRFLRINPISRYILGLPYYKNYTGSRENLALYSGSFARIISYVVMKERYLNGYGTGSCYIAELHHDFGFWGIIIGNWVYGILLKRISTLNKGKVLMNTIHLMMFRNLLMAPRYSFDNPFFVAFSYGFWIYIILVFLTANLLKKNIRKS